MRAGWLAALLFLLAYPDPGHGQSPRRDRYGDPLPEGVSARLGPLRFRHDGNVHALLYSPDGKILAGQVAHDVFLWESASGRLLHRLANVISPCPQDFFAGDRYRACLWLRAFDFTPDGKALAAVDCKQGIGLWDTSTGRLLRRLPLPGQAEDGATLRCCPDGKRLAVATKDDRLCLLEASTGKVCWQKKLAPKHLPFALAFAPDGKRLALNGPDRGVQLWDAESGKLLRRIEEKGKSGVGDFAFSADGATLAVSRSRAIVLSDAATGKERKRLPIASPSEEGVLALAFASSGELVSCNLSGKAHVWNLATGKARFLGCAERLMGDGFGKPTFTAMALSPDGKTVALGDLSTVLSLFDVATGKQRFPEFQGHDAAIRHLAFLSDGKTLISSDTEGGSLLVWDTTRGQLLRRWPAQAFHFAAAPDGCRLAALTGPQDGEGDRIGARVWDPIRNAKLAGLPIDDRDRGFATSLRQLAFAMGGRRVIGVGIRDENRGVLLAWDSCKGALLHRLLLPALADPDMHFEEDWTPGALVGERVALVPAAAGTLVCDLERMKVCYLSWKHIRAPLALSVDGRIALCREANGVSSWELLSERQIRPPTDLRELIHGLEALSHDGRLGAAYEWSDLGPHGERTATVHVWDMVDKRRLGRMKVTESTPLDVCFSPDGARMALGLGNGSILLCDVPSVAPRRIKVQPLTARQLRACWADLASADPTPAYQAIARLAASPQEALPLLREQLRPAGVDAGQIRLLIAELDSSSFEDRQRATAKLQAQLDLCEGLLREELAQKPTLEARRRIEGLLAKVDAPITEGEALRRLRSLAVLEHIGGVQARAILRQLANGAPETRLTREAKAALERLRCQ